MIIIPGWPPNIDLLDATFKVRARAPGDVIFAYGDKIYVPGGGGIAPHLVAHEGAHGVRQRGMGVDRWWDRYVVDIEFRLAEEIIGHRAEYRALCNESKDRELCSRHLMYVARKLAAPLYGSLISPIKARNAIRG